MTVAPSPAVLETGVKIPVIAAMAAVTLEKTVEKALESALATFCVSPMTLTLLIMVGNAMVSEKKVESSTMFLYFVSVN